MSARNGLAAKAARRVERNARHRRSEREQTVVRHGVCRQCSRRTLIWLPANLCERDLLEAAATAGILFDHEAAGLVLSGEDLPDEVPYE